MIGGKVRLIKWPIELKLLLKNKLVNKRSQKITKIHERNRDGSGYHSVEIFGDLVMLG